MPSRGQRVLLAQRMTLHANVKQGKPQGRRCWSPKWNLREKSRSCDIAVVARRRFLKFLLLQFHNFVRNISRESRSPPRLFRRTPPSQAIAVWCGACSGRILWRPHMPLPVLAIICLLMYTHTFMVLQQMSQHSQHQSTARIRVPSGPFGLAEQGLLFEHFFLFQNFQSG